MSQVRKEQLEIIELFRTCLCNSWLKKMISLCIFVSQTTSKNLRTMSPGSKAQAKCCRKTPVAKIVPKNYEMSSQLLLVGKLMGVWVPTIAYNCDNNRHFGRVPLLLVDIGIIIYQQHSIIVAESLPVHSWRTARLDTDRSTELFLPPDFRIWSNRFELYKKDKSRLTDQPHFSVVQQPAVKTNIWQAKRLHRMYLPAHRSPNKHRIQTARVTASWL